MYPIVLAHGIARFDAIRNNFIKITGLDSLIGDTFHYFKGIKSHLSNNGFVVYHGDVSFAGSVSVRAMQLASQVDEIIKKSNAEKVHIIAHSMGGLDARHMIVDIDGMDKKVASVTTIGTPHLGTAFADVGISSGGIHAINILDDIIKLYGFKDLTTSSCNLFNNRAENKEASNEVRYCVQASAEEKSKVFFPLQASWSLINEKEGENDGLVSVKSQLWTSCLVGMNGRRKNVEQHHFPVPADHLNQIGWWDINESEWMEWSMTKIKKYEATICDIYLSIAQQCTQEEKV